MKTSTIKWSTIKNLLKYDWAINHKGFLYLIGSLEASILAICFIVFAYNGFFINSSFAPIIENLKIGTTFAAFVSWICLYFWQINVIQSKFSKIQTASTYLMLPATSLEKAIVVHIETFTFFIITSILYCLNFYTLESILYTMSNNPAKSFVYLFDDINFRDLFSSYNYLWLMSLVSIQLFSYILFLVNTMFFKKMVIPKALLTQFSIFILFIIYSIKVFSIFSSSINNTNIEPMDMMPLLPITMLIIIGAAITMLFKAFHNKIIEREAK